MVLNASQVTWLPYGDKFQKLHTFYYLVFTPAHGGGEMWKTGVFDEITDF